MNTDARLYETRYPTRDEIDWYIARGRRLRAEVMAAGFRAAGAWLRGRLGGPLRRRPGTEEIDTAAATSLRTPLTAIRSAAEILHDHPDMAPQERARFVRILLDEEQRLERLLAALMPGEVGRLAR